MTGRLHNARGRSAHGFTLIELLVVLAVVAALAAIAYPSYREHLARTQRVAAQSALLENAQAMQRYYMGNNTFEGAVDASLATTRSPREGGIAYTLSVMRTPPTQTAWTLVATPVGSMADDRCGRLTLDQTGRQGVENDGTGTVASCWR